MMSRIYLKMLQQRKGRLREDAPSRRNRECGAPETSKGQGEVGAGGQRRECLGSGPAEETSQGGDNTPEGVGSSVGEGPFGAGRGRGTGAGHAREQPPQAFRPALRRREKDVHQSRGRSGMALQGWLALLSSSLYPVLTGSATCSGFGHPAGIT